MRNKTIKFDIITIIVSLLAAAAVILSFVLPTNDADAADSGHAFRPLLSCDLFFSPVLFRMK